MNSSDLILQSSNEPPLKPIIDPSCYQPTERASRKPNRLALAFTAPKPAGSLAKKGKEPLGKTYRRTTSVERVVGPEVLPIDPRPDAKYGDGVVTPPDTKDHDQVIMTDEHRPSNFSTDSSTSAPIPSSWDRTSQSTTATSILTSPSASESAPTLSAAHPKFMTHSSSAISGNNSDTSTPSLRFCPLPSTGRKPRRQSISLGVTARATLLAQQNQNQNQNQTQNQRQPFPFRGWDSIHQEQQMPQHTCGGPAPVRDDVVDLGQVVQKGVKKIFGRLRKDPTSLAQVQEKVEPTLEARHSINMADLERNPDLAPQPRNKQEFTHVPQDHQRQEGNEQEEEEEEEEEIDAEGIPTPSTSSTNWANPNPFEYDSREVSDVTSQKTGVNLDSRLGAAVVR